VRQRVVAKIGRDIGDAQPLSAGQELGRGVRELRLPHARGCERAVLRVLLRYCQREVCTERVGHCMEGLHWRQASTCQVIANLWQKLCQLPCTWSTTYTSAFTL
jgi:hypothetical protein